MLSASLPCQTEGKFLQALVKGDMNLISLLLLLQSSLDIIIVVIVMISIICLTIVILVFVAVRIIILPMFSIITWTPKVCKIMAQNH